MVVLERRTYTQMQRQSARASLVEIMAGSYAVVDYEARIQRSERALLRIVKLGRLPSRLHWSITYPSVDLRESSATLLVRPYVHTQHLRLLCEVSTTECPLFGAHFRVSSLTRIGASELAKRNPCHNGHITVGVISVPPVTQVT